MLHILHEDIIYFCADGRHCKCSDSLLEFKYLLKLSVNFKMSQSVMKFYRYSKKFSGIWIQS